MCASEQIDKQFELESPTVQANEVRDGFILAVFSHEMCA